MLVDVARDGEVASGAVSLDGQPVLVSARSWPGFDGSEDVESVPAGRDFDVVAWVCLEECSCGFVGFAGCHAVVDVDSADTVSEYESEPCPCR